jgi:hypothetical protein
VSAWSSCAVGIATVWRATSCAGRPGPTLGETATGSERVLISRSTGFEPHSTVLDGYAEVVELRIANERATMLRRTERMVDGRWQTEKTETTEGTSQRFTGTFANGGNTIDGLWQLCEDDVHWNDALAITYRRV